MEQIAHRQNRDVDNTDRRSGRPSPAALIMGVYMHYLVFLAYNMLNFMTLRRMLINSGTQHCQVWTVTPPLVRMAQVKLHIVWAPLPNQ